MSPAVRTKMALMIMYVKYAALESAASSSPRAPDAICATESISGGTRGRIRTTSRRNVPAGWSGSPSTTRNNSTHASSLRTCHSITDCIQELSVALPCGQLGCSARVGFARQGHAVLPPGTQLPRWSQAWPIGTCYLLSMSRSIKQCSSSQRRWWHCC